MEEGARAAIRIWRGPFSGRGMYNGPILGAFYFCNGLSAKGVVCTKFMSVVRIKLKYSNIKMLGEGVCLDVILTALYLGAVESR